MAKINLNKSGLQKEKDQMRLYQRVLPSLDLKRQQLTGELTRAKDFLKKTLAEVEDLKSQISSRLPMLANQDIEVSGLVKVQSVQIEEENVVGVKLPALREVKCEVQEYSLLAKPYWVDELVDRLKEMAERRAKVRIWEERVRRLNWTVRRTTQRVNLLDKILIPTAKKNIRRIQIILGDVERSAVVRSKLSKAKQRKKHESVALGESNP